MTMHPRLLPKDPHDLSLAPVAVTIDRNLQTLRDLEPSEIVGYLELMLDRPERTGNPEERAAGFWRPRCAMWTAMGGRARSPPTVPGFA